MKFNTRAIIAQAQAILSSEFPIHIKDRGLSYFNADRIVGFDFDRKRNKLSFLVQGSQDYVLEMEVFDAKNITLPNCNCPYNANCKHQAALLYWITQNEEVLNELLNSSISIEAIDGKSSTFKVSNYEKLTANWIGQNLSHAYRSHFTLTNYLLRNTNKNTFSGTCYYAKERYYSTSLAERHHQHLQIEVKEKDLYITCDCDKAIKGSCEHINLLLQELAKKNQIIYLSGLPKDEIEDSARKSLRAYGLPEDQGWEKYLQFAINNQGFGCLPTEQYSDLYAPFQIQRSGIFEKLSSTEEKQVPTENEENTDWYQLAFCFWFSPNNDDFTIFPVIGTKGKKGELMEIKFQAYDKNTTLPIVYKSNDHALINLSNRTLENYKNFSFNHSNISSNVLINDYLDDFQAHPFLFICKGFQPYYSRKADLSPIEFHPGLPQIKVTFTEKDGFIKQHSRLMHKNNPMDCNDSSIEHYNKHFFKIGETLYYLPDSKTSAQFDLLEVMQGKRFSKAIFPQIFEEQIKPLAAYFEMDFSRIKNLQMTTKELSDPQKEIYLSELNDFVIIRPVLKYADNTYFDVKVESSSISLEDNVIVQKVLDATTASEYLSFIENLHPTFPKQKRADFFHLSYAELMKNDAFLGIFGKLNEENISVFGLKNLKKLKVSPYYAKVDYHVESGTDWFDIQTSFYFGDEEVTVADLKKKFIPGSSYVSLSDGKKGVIPKDWLKKLERLFLHGEVKNGSVSISKKHFSLVDQLFENLENEEVLTEIKDRKQKLLNFKQLNLHPIPETVKANLRHYQEDGFQWLCFLDEFQWGGILADDMGLGKTLQVITFLSHVIQKNPQTNLIVVPTSLLFNWENELKKFAPHLNAHFYYGTNRIKSTEEFKQYDIIFTSYGLMLSDIKLLKEHHFNYVILDESQAIKNTASKRFKAARLLQANNRIAMTGTPIENHTFDLYAQMSFLNPGFLGSAKSFRENYAVAIDRNRNPEKAMELQQMIKPFVLRRTKEQVATELPDKTEDVLYCSLDKEQRKIYDAHRNDIKDKLLNKIEEEGLAKARFSVLEGLTRLRLVCDSPEILAGEEKYSSESAKLKLLKEHISENTPNHKVLIFSQFVKMLKLIEKELQDSGYDYAYLDGQSSQKQRQQNVAKFQEEEACRIFLVSLKAGGTGLNLVAADYVYIVDPWWNPAVENQAIDRCYRIGQKKKVIAYRMICKDTIEEKIMDLKSRKKAIAGDIISTDENTLKQLGEKDILALFE